MKRTFIPLVIAAAAALASLCSCSKTYSQGINDSKKTYFDAWARKYCPGQEPVFPGIYILEDKPGTGETVGEPADDLFLLADYNITDLKGNYTTSTSRQMAHDRDKFDTTYYYGPHLIPYSELTVYSGLRAALKDMKVGGSRKVAIPGWLLTNARYDTSEEYLRKEEGKDNCIYEIDLVEKVTSEAEWELKVIDGYLREHYGLTAADSLAYGFYLILEDGTAVTQANEKSEFSSDTTFYLNYTGRRVLDGGVFDTTVERTGRDYGLKKSSYSNVLINWGDKFSDITMTDNKTETITGFSYGLFNMAPHKKATAIFHSAWGYKSSGSGESIPAYCPLAFELEIDKNGKN